MRKVVYSSITKLVAVLLLIACIVVGALFTTAGIYEYFHSEEDIYAFEDDFSESWYVRSLLDTIIVCPRERRCLYGLFAQRA